MMTSIQNSYIQFYKGEFNKKFWNDDDKIKENIRKKLLQVAYDFYNDFELNAEIIDIILTGSLANYNWTNKSDLDVHIIIDYSKIDENKNILKGYIDNKRTLWNLKHNIVINNHNVELYIQDVNEPHNSSGIYSLLKNKWIVKPKKINNTKKLSNMIKEVNFKYKTYKSGIEMLEKLSEKQLEAEMYKKYYIIAKKYKKRIVNKRKEYLSKYGEYSLYNLIFKKLRNNNYLNKLNDVINKLYDLYIINT